MTGPDTDAPPAVPDASGGSAPSRRLLLVLGVLCALLAAAALVLGFQLRGYAQQEDARQDAVRAARQSALNLTSIDYQDFDAAVKRVLEGATGDFGDEYEQNSGNLKDLLLKNEVRSEGTVVESGVVRSDRRNATVLVVVDSTVRNLEAPEGRTSTSRMQLEVQKVGDRWLTADLRFVG